MVYFPSLLEAERVSWEIIVLYFPYSWFFISIASGQVGRTLEHMNPGLTPNGYFYVLVTADNSDPSNSASVAAPQEWADQAFAECADLCNLFLAPQQGDAK